VQAQVLMCGFDRKFCRLKVSLLKIKSMVSMCVDRAGRISIFAAIYVYQYKELRALRALVSSLGRGM
jgi:hypothetical protein